MIPEALNNRLYLQVICGTDTSPPALAGIRPLQVTDHLSKTMHMHMHLHVQHNHRYVRELRCNPKQ